LSFSVRRGYLVDEASVHFFDEALDALLEALLQPCSRQLAAAVLLEELLTRAVLAHVSVNRRLLPRSSNVNLYLPFPS